ncbi:hypothetical protein V2A60_010450 [Cordyceps javanica]
MTEDGAEVNPDTKALTGQMRVVDALKAYDKATPIIASGGVTTSLIIPGSSNLIGGEGAPVKNALYSGANGEPIVEEVLLERGMPQHERRRYMKMAFGENPKSVWKYSRLGNAWHLREHFQKAKEVLQSQDDFCAGLEFARKGRSKAKVGFLAENGRFPFNFELESIVALLRGQVSLHNHNYEPQDLETMIRISEEFGFEISGFHHAIEAWQVPGLLKERVPNITIATFAEFSLYKHESYWPSLYAGNILDKSGIKVAYKSDHVESFTNAKYLLSQAAVAHAFNLPAEKALQAVTSIPAAAIDQDHRVGHCKAGYDADIVVWDDHPLVRGATPLQVFIDGIAQLNDTLVKKSMGSSWAEPLTDSSSRQATLQVRYEPDEKSRDDTCETITRANGNIIISGISQAFLKDYPELSVGRAAVKTGSLQLILKNGRIVCAGTLGDCKDSRTEVEATEGYARLQLTNGHVVPGMSALTNALGAREIATDPDTGDGSAGGQSLNDPESIVYAKHAALLDGKNFARARLGGVTRAITAPVADGPAFVSGVSVEILTSGKRSLLHGGIVQEEVALHMALGDAAIKDEGTGSNGIKSLRKMLSDGLGKNNQTVFGRVATGHLPLLVYADNKYEIEQLIWIKRDHPDTKLVLVGAMEAPFVAQDLADADIPVILTEDRGAPTSFRTRDGFVGPPLSRSIASHLKEAGVKFGLALLDLGMPSDYKIHDLLPEAGWTAKYADLSDSEAVELVTSNIEDILHLKQKNKDVVVYEGDPLHYGATVAIVLAADDKAGTALAQLPGIPTVPFKADGKNAFKLPSVGAIIVDTKYSKTADKSGLTLIPPTLHEFGTTFAQDLQEVLNKTVTAKEGDTREPNTIFLTIDSDHTFLDAAGRSTSEGYTIDAEEDGVTIRGASALGAWWGTRTLLQQAILGDDGAVPVGRGDDAPGWATRGMMLDCGRHFYPKEFLIDMCSYISFFKQNTFHVHLSDNTIVPTYTPDNYNDTYARFRLWSESSELSGLNKHANESYTKDDFDDIQTKCAQRGVTVIPEIEAPGHCLPIVQWRPQIGYQGDLSLLNISHPDTIPTMKAVWKEFLPWFHSSVVSIGADEYKGPEEDYKKFVNEMSDFIYQQAGKSIRIWGTFPAVKHAGSSTTVNSNITIQHWAYLFDNPYEDYIKNNYSVINSDEMYYIVMKDGPYGRTVNTSTTFTGNPDGRKPWYPNIFNLSNPNQNPSRDNKLIQGAIAPLWNDHGANTSVYSEAYYAWREGIPALADKHWGGNLTQEQYSNWFSKLLAKIPNQDLERRIPSKHNTIFSYDLRKVKGESIADKSGNKYDAKTTCKAADDGIVMSPECDITTPWSSKGRNYTLSLTVNVDKLSDDGNTTLVSGSDSVLMLTPNVTLFASGTYYRLNKTIPLQSWVRLEISGEGPKTFASAFNEKGDKLFSREEFLTEMSYYGAPLRWHEMAIEAPIHQITGWQGKVRDFTLRTDGTGDSQPGSSSTTLGLPSMHIVVALCIVVSFVI